MIGYVHNAVQSIETIRIKYASESKHMTKQLILISKNAGKLRKTSYY